MRKLRNLLLAGQCLLLVSGAAYAGGDGSLILNNLFSDHMVIQRDKPIPVWGRGEPGRRIAIGFKNQCSTAVVGPDSTWMVWMEAEVWDSVPADIVITDLSNRIRISDVLVGEVWMATGQSNMDWRVEQCNIPAIELARSDNYDRIRLFDMPKKFSLEPLDQVEAQWVPSTNMSARLTFSAAAYFFAREVYREQGIPIGLINPSFGGTHIDTWICPEGWEMIPELSGIYEQGKKNIELNPYDKNGVCLVYNSSVHPLVPFAIRGFIWHQGEGNNQDGYLYLTKLKALIGGYREIWNDSSLCMGVGQLFPFDPIWMETDLLTKFNTYCRTMYAQALTPDSIPGTGSIFLSDLGRPYDIHPLEKAEMGRRYGLWALSRVYGDEELVYSGPMARSAVLSADGNYVHVYFDHTGAGLKTYDGKPPRWFKFVCSDGKDRGSSYTELSDDGHHVIIRVPWHGDAELLKLTHAWSPLAIPNLMNSEGLPASLFELDITKQ